MIKQDTHNKILMQDLIKKIYLKIIKIVVLDIKKELIKIWEDFNQSLNKCSLKHLVI